jgi:hypothetical protein
MALSYGQALALAYDRRRGFRAWVDCDGRYEKNSCLVRCNAQKRVQALPTMPLRAVNTVDPPLNGYSTESGHKSTHTNGQTHEPTDKTQKPTDKTPQTHPPHPQVGVWT